MVLENGTKGMISKTSRNSGIFTVFQKAGIQYNH